MEQNRKYTNTQLYSVKYYYHFTKQYYRLAKIEELETNSKIKNIRDSYRCINEFKKGYQPRTNRVKDEKGVILLQTPTAFWLGGGNISPSY